MMCGYEYVVHKVSNSFECNDSVVKQKDVKSEVKQPEDKPEEPFDTVFQRALAQPHEIID